VTKTSRGEAYEILIQEQAEEKRYQSKILQGSDK